MRIGAFISLLIATVGFSLWLPQITSAPTTIDDFTMPGSQPGDAGTIETPAYCDNCHAGYDQDVEPVFNWRGSMMAQAARDPLFFATMAIANQDAPESGDLCIRCHSPKGWLEGRSSPTDASALTAEDRESVMCDFCHRLVKPTPLGVNPYTGDALYTSDTYPLDQAYLATIDEIPPVSAHGMFVVDDNTDKRGPLSDPASPHQSIYSPFHKEAALCGTCHDVSNPVFSAAGNGRYAPNAFGEPAPDLNPTSLFPIERTYSEWTASAYNSPTGIYAPQFGGNKDYVATCQDCHMRDVIGKACNKHNAPVRTDMPLHDMTGGNTFVPLLINEVYPGEPDVAALNAGIVRAQRMLELAANMDVNVVADADSFKAIVHVTNETGHKLPSGYPEGRRIWIQVQALDGEGHEVFESGAYDAGSGVLDEDAYLKIYHIEPGISPGLASALGATAGPSFHFVLNDTVYFDNRIPPRGFTNAGFQAIQSPPVGYTYPDGQYWDETEYPIPRNAREVRATLYYQTTSKEFVEFLKDENTTNSLGDDIYDLWTEHGKSPPVAMQRDTFMVANPVPTADMKVFLEGPYAGSGSMSTGATFQSAAPLTQPYGGAEFIGTDNEYHGTESVSSWDASYVDWVLVEFRSGTGAATAVDTMAAMLLTDGSIVSPGEMSLYLPSGLSGSYYLVVRHRNHLAIMSSSAIDFSSGSGSWDFTTASGQAYTSGGAAMKPLTGGGYGMFAADANGDGLVTALDFTAWIASTTAGETGYRRTDFNLDGHVTALDFTTWIANTTAGAASRVP